uniref:Exonuclease 3'-5' domain-containing protein 2 n=2 Tax=Cacopsylla melanoneura TaxID=428564 RepID=A0A8D9EHF2_9HEMI
MALNSFTLSSSKKPPGFKYYYPVIIPAAGLMCVYIFRKQIMSGIRAFFNKTKKINQVFYVESKQECDEIIKKHFRHHQVLGLDCEWVTIGSHRGPVSLLQLASPDGVCALFRLPKIYQYDYFHDLKSIPQSLEDLLFNENILKVGVAIENDSKYLSEDYNVLLSSWLDLRHLAKDNDVTPKGLAYLAQETVGIKLEKKFNVRVSNWDADVLTEEQIHYAAMDAYVAVKIFSHFVAIQQSLWNLLQSSRSSLFSSYIENHCSYYREVPYKDKHSHSHNSRNPQHTVDSSLGQSQKRPFSTFERPWRGFKPGKIYDNCYLLDSLGQTLCACERKKAQWYLDKGLGTLVKQDPFTVRLTFQPEGFDMEDCKYYAEEKKNQCVVCGSEERYSLVKKYIVPHEYRKHMPECMKDRRSHDVLLMCYRCHKRSNIKDQAMRRVLADLCSAPLDSKTNTSVITIDNIRKVKSAARALRRNFQSGLLPPQRVDDLSSIVSEYFSLDSQYDGVEFEELVQLGSNLCETVDNADFVPHGFAVVEYFQNDLEAFETKWRQHFLQTMQPQHLPKHWSLHHNFNRRENKANRVKKIRGSDEDIDSGPSIGESKNRGSDEDLDNGISMGESNGVVINR